MACLNLIPSAHLHPFLQFSVNSSSFPTTQKTKWKCTIPTSIIPLTILYCSNSTAISAPQTEEDAPTSPAVTGSAPPLKQKRIRYRKLYPGEKDGITEEMRFIAMKLRNSGKPRRRRKKSDQSTEESVNGSLDTEEEEDVGGGGNGNGNGGTWEPSMEGLLKYLVDSKLVFSTIERIVLDESHDVSYAYFRKTGLERAECISKDLEWLKQEGNLIPEPSNPGITYAKYLDELGEKSPNLFLCHLYSIYFSHIAGGQMMAKRVYNELLEGRALEFCNWEGEEDEFLRVVRNNLNMLGEHWSRDEKNKCLREVTKAFRFLGQIVCFIVV